MREQRRSRVIAMSTDELDAFLAQERTCRLATVGPGGPHNSPVWFIWSGGALWVYSLIRSQRWTDIERDPRVSAVIDAGHHYDELPIRRSGSASSGISGDSSPVRGAGPTATAWPSISTPCSSS